MTTLIPFTPTALAPFTFQPVLDGQTYNAFVPWALWGQRWYLSLLAPSGDQVVYTAIVESGDLADVSLATTAGLYMATVSPPAAPGQYLNFQVRSTNVPSGTTIAASAGNGVVRLSQPALTTGADQNAVLDFTVDLVAGFGFASTLVFRASSQQFEVT